MVGGAVTHPAATPEPDLRLSHSSGSSVSGSLEEIPLAVDFIVAMSMK